METTVPRSVEWGIIVGFLIYKNLISFGVFPFFDILAYLIIYYRCNVVGFMY